LEQDLSLLFVGGTMLENLTFCENFACMIGWTNSSAWHALQIKIHQVEWLWPELNLWFRKRKIHNIDTSNKPGSFNEF